MNKESYQKEIMRTSGSAEAIGARITQYISEPLNVMLIHGAIGITTESGELMDALKKWMMYGNKLDLTNIKEELGDIEWYLALIRNALNVSQEEVQQLNLAKLKKRYPEKFTAECANNRDIDNEMSVFEDA